jgi:hypothetical protein
VALRGDALRLERVEARLLEQLREVLARRLVADLAVRLAADEGQVGDIVGLACRIAALQDGLR